LITPTEEMPKGISSVLPTKKRITMPLKIVFAGTPIFALESLTALHESQHDVIAVYTQPDKPAGRGKQLTQSPVKEYALTHGLSIYQPKTLRAAKAQQTLAALKPDVMVVAAYGLILPKAVLEIPSKGCINIHASLLPRWRGAAPIQHAILAGDKETGITIMKMDEGLDTGDMLLKSSLTISKEDTAGTLHDKLADVGAKLIIEAMDNLDNLSPEKQNEKEACYAAKIEKAHANIDWKQDACQIARFIRAYQPWPIAYSMMGELIVKIHQAHPITGESNAVPGSIIEVTKDQLLINTGQGLLAITKMQLPGKKAMPVRDILNAKAAVFANGKVFGI